MHDISNVIRELTAAEVNAVAGAGIYSSENGCVRGRRQWEYSSRPGPFNAYPSLDCKAHPGIIGDTLFVDAKLGRHPLRSFLGSATPRSRTGIDIAQSAPGNDSRFGQKR